mgnify:CR=1 FL=1
MFPDPRRYDDLEYLEAAEALEDEYPRIAKGLRIMIGDAERSAPSESDLDKEARQLLSVIQELDTAMLADDWAARIEKEFDTIASQNPELTETKYVREGLETLVEKRFIGKSFDEKHPDAEPWYGPIPQILGHIVFYKDDSDFLTEFPGKEWTPEKIKKASEETGMHPADLTKEIGDHSATKQLYLPPLEKENVS